jgi:hypothetical protein
LYLTIVENYQNTLQARRYMATTAATTTGDAVRVSWLLSDSSNWQQKLKELHSPGDILVCQQEQWVRDGTLKTIPMSDYLKIKYQAPIIALTGFYHPQREQIRRWVTSLIFWIGSLLILGLFTFLEIQVDQKMLGFERAIMLFLCILAETGTILFLHNLTNR